MATPKTGNPRGRPAGKRSERTVARERAIEAAGIKVADAIGEKAFRGDAHAFLMSVYKDPDQEIDLRIDCAKAAAPYEKPRLSNIEANVAITGHEAALDELE